MAGTSPTLTNVPVEQDPEPQNTSPTLTNVPVEQDPEPQNTSSSTVQPTPAYEARRGRRERDAGEALGLPSQPGEDYGLHHGRPEYRLD